MRALALFLCEHAHVHTVAALCSAHACVRVFLYQHRMPGTDHIGRSPLGWLPEIATHASMRMALLSVAGESAADLKLLSPFPMLHYAFGHGLSQESLRLT